MAFSQDIAMDSLRNLLRDTGEDTLRVSLLNEISTSYSNHTPDSSVHYANLALDLATTLGYEDGVYIAYARLSENYEHIGEYQKSIFYSNKAIDMARKRNDQKNLSSLYSSIGLVYYDMGNYATSLDYHSRALQISIKQEDEAGIIRCYNNLGMGYAETGDLEKALEYFLKCLALDEANGNKEGLAIRSANIGTIYKDTGQPEEALLYHFKSLEIAKELGLMIGVVINEINIGVNYTILGNYEQALNYLNSGLVLSRKYNLKSNLCESLGALGEVYNLMGDQKRAIKSIKEAIQIAEEIDYVDAVLNGTESLYRIYDSRKDYKNALTYHKTFKQLSDSLFNKESTSKIAKIEAEFEFEQERDSIHFANETKLFMVNEELKVQRFVQYASFGGVLLLIALLLVLYYYYRLKHRANKQLVLLNEEVALQNEKLTKLIEEKDDIMKIISHDLRTPFAQVKSMVDLMNEDMIDVNERGVMTHLLGKSLDNGLSLIGNLTIANNPNAMGGRDFEMTTFDLSNFLNQILNHFRDSAADKEITVEHRFSSNFNATIDEHILTRIVENLISNAIKYSNQGTSIFVSLEKMDDHFELSVKDEGPGIKAGDRIKLFKKYSRLENKPTGGEPSTGLGLYIVKELTEKMGGEVRIESEWGQGSVFTVRLPLDISHVNVA